MDYCFEWLMDTIKKLHEKSENSQISHFSHSKKIAFMLVASMRHPNHPDTPKSLVILIYS